MFRQTLKKSGTIIQGPNILQNGREVRVTFNNAGDTTEVTVIFDPETENPIEMQRVGWLAILNNFKKYTETN